MHWDHFKRENFGNKRKRYSENLSWKLNPNTFKLRYKACVSQYECHIGFTVSWCLSNQACVHGRAALARTQMKL